MNISTIEDKRYSSTSSFYLAVTLAKIRQETEVVINECTISFRQTTIAKRKPINVDDHALK